MSFSGIDMCHADRIQSNYFNSLASLLIFVQTSGATEQREQMGITPKEKIDAWMEASGQLNKGPAVENRVVTAGEFLEKTGRMSQDEACSCLTGIDFSMPVTVVRLPDVVYVQFVQQHKGIWFTNTGLTADDVGLAQGRRLRKLFSPIGAVPALQSTARSIKDTWTKDRLFQSVSPQARGKMGQMTKGGGTQYIVFDKTRMRELQTVSRRG